IGRGARPFARHRAGLFLRKPVTDHDRAFRRTEAQPRLARRGGESPAALKKTQWVMVRREPVSYDPVLLVWINPRMNRRRQYDPAYRVRSFRSRPDAAAGGDRRARAVRSAADRRRVGRRGAFVQ